MIITICCHSILRQGLVEVFFALHGMPAWTSYEKRVRPSVKRVDCDKTEERSDLSRFLYHTKDHLEYFSEKKNGCWGANLLPEILGQPAPIGAKSPILNRFARSASAVTV